MQWNNFSKLLVKTKKGCVKKKKTFPCWSATHALNYMSTSSDSPQKGCLVLTSDFFDNIRKRTCLLKNITQHAFPVISMQTSTMSPSDTADLSWYNALWHVRNDNLTYSLHYIEFSAFAVDLHLSSTAARPVTPCSQTTPSKCVVFSVGASGSEGLTRYSHISQLHLRRKTLTT